MAADLARSRSSGGLYVLGYPRSGTTWMAGLCADYLGWPIQSGSSSPRGLLGPRVFHLHRFVPTRRAVARTVYVIRDGRDSIVSRYFRHANHATARLRRRAAAMLPAPLEAENIETNLPAYIEMLSGSRYASIDYRGHVETAARRGYVTVRYEDLVADTHAALGATLRAVLGTEIDDARVARAVERNTFEARSGRSVGIEEATSFYRKGIAGDWKTYFTRRAAEVFDEYAGDALIDLGYESDHGWVQQVGD